MKAINYIFFWWLLLSGLQGAAQFSTTSPEGITFTGTSYMFIPKNATLHVDGNFRNNNVSTGPTCFRSNGTISLTGNLLSNGAVICTRASSLTPTCKFIFTPKTDTISIITNTDSLILYHVYLNKPNTFVRLPTGSKVKILDTVEFQGGNILLDGGIVYLNEVQGTPSYINRPFLLNESHNSRIFGTSGYVEMQPLVTSSTTATGGFINPANMGLFLTKANVESDTMLTIRRGHKKQLYAGNGSILRYYDVLTDPDPDHAIAQPVKINYIDSAEYINIGINRNSLSVFASPRESDMDYFELPATNTLTAHLADAATNTFTLGNIDPHSFRITVADKDCANPPLSALSASTINLCAGQSYTLDAGNNSSVPSTSLLWNWSTATNPAYANSQSIVVTSTTTAQVYTVTLRDVRGCITKDTVWIAPTAPTPTLTIYGASACFGDSLRFKATTAIASGTVTNYFWQYGDATTFNTSLSDTIRKVYATAGIYTVAVTATSNFGCTASKSQSVVAIPLPVANFAATFNCLTGYMDFSPTTVASSTVDPIANNYWNFNMATTSTLTPMGATVTPGYSYTPGTYSVQLVARSGGGCKDTIIKTVTVYPKNVSSFTTTANACLGDTISLTNNSICNTGPCNYAWDFGDGQQSVAPNPKHVYTSANAFNIKLKVLNALSCTDSVTVPVIINPKPLTAFTSNSPLCFGDVSYFTNTSTIATGSIVSYNWNLGNATTSTNTNTSLTYTAPGNYNVSLTATSNLGCAFTNTQVIVISPKPTAQYNVANVCFGQASAFNDNSIGTGLSYHWDFGNTITSTVSNPNYTYASAGTYSTFLIVTNGSGCSDTAYVNATVYAVPAPYLGTATVTTCGNTYTLNAGPGASYLWQPQNATSQQVLITSSGNYSVTVTDANNCIGSAQIYVGLNLPVKPHLGNDTTSCGPYLMNSGYLNSTYLWTTPTQTVATTQTFLATLPSTYVVTVTDGNNCTGSDTVIVQINTPPTLSLGVDITQCKTPQPLVLSPTTNASIYQWSTGSAQPTVAINNSGTYAVTVTAVNGCKKSDTIAVTLLPSPVINLGADATVCGVKLLDAQNAGFNYLWSTSQVTQTISATTTGAYDVKVTNPGNGCVSRDTINLIISTPINVSLGSDTSICSNNTFVLDAGNPGSTYNWSNGPATQTVVTGSSGAYAVTVTNGACSAFDAVTVTVLNAPVVDLGNNIRYLCGNGTVVLNAGSAGNVTWGSTNSFTSNDPVINVSQSGKYWAIVSNGACSASDTVEVIQSNQLLTAYFVASTVDTVGKPIKFVDVSMPTPTSWSWNFGDGFYSTEQSPEHVFLTSQTYSVTLIVSNGFCESQITKALQVLRKAAVTPKSNPASLEMLNYTLYPNPADQSFRTVLELNDVANIDFSIYDVTGKMVYKLFKNQVSVFDEEIDSSVLRMGMYMVEIIAQSNKGFVKQMSKLVIAK
jgi:PKD repeat protein